MVGAGHLSLSAVIVAGDTEAFVVLRGVFNKVFFGETAFREMLLTGSVECRMPSTRAVSDCAVGDWDRSFHKAWPEAVVGVATAAALDVPERSGNHSEERTAGLGGALFPEEEKELLSHCSAVFTHSGGGGRVQPRCPATCLHGWALASFQLGQLIPCLALGPLCSQASPALAPHV